MAAFATMAGASTGVVPAGLRAAGAHHLCRFVGARGGSVPQVGVLSPSSGSVWPLADCLRSEDVAANALRQAAQAGDMVGVMVAWEGAVDAQLHGKGEQLKDLALHAPLRPSRNVMAVGKNYKPHVREVDSSLPGIAVGANPAAPIIFTKAPECVVGPDAAIRLPPPHVSTRVDYEGEVALVLGEGGQVFGVTCLNDVTARDAQRRHQQWFLGKSCDTFCPLGPWLALADTVDWRRGLEVITRVNGEERQRGDGRQLLFSPQSIIDTIGAGTSLVAGDVIATGTPAGVGAGFDPPRFLKHDDVVEVEVEGVGVLRNTVQGHA